MEKKDLWKNLLYTFLGTTLSIVLTFGTSQWLALKKQKEERELTALMVMGNVEKFASTLELISDELTWRDTLATMLLKIPEDSIDAPEYADMVQALPNVLACPVISYDQTVEQIFSNSIETWKNMGNFQFINIAGQCFSTMKFVTDEYMDFIKGGAGIIDMIQENPDAYPGGTIYSKVLRSKEFRDKMEELHKRTTYCLYMAEVIRYYNAINMQLMDVSEEEVRKFVSEHDEEVKINRPLPVQQDYIAPDLKADSLPDFPTWIKNHRV